MSVSARVYTSKTILLISFILSMSILSSGLYYYQHVLESVRMSYPQLMNSTTESAVVTTVPSVVSTSPQSSTNLELLEAKTLMTSYILSTNHKVFPELATIITDAIFENADKYHIPAEIILALIMVESHFDYTALSNKAAIGLMQIHVPTWVTKSKKSSDKENLVAQGILRNKWDLYDPAKNIASGCYILSYYLKHSLKHHKNESHLQYALTHYLGGNRNKHFLNMSKELGAYRVYCLTASE